MPHFLHMRQAVLCSHGDLFWGQHFNKLNFALYTFTYYCFSHEQLNIFEPNKISDPATTFTASQRLAELDPATTFTASQRLAELDPATTFTASQRLAELDPATTFTASQRLAELDPATTFTASQRLAELDPATTFTASQRLAELDPATTFTASQRLETQQQPSQPARDWVPGYLCLQRRLSQLSEGIESIINRIFPFCQSISALSSNCAYSI